MKRRDMQKYVKTGQGGFTLIELLIVVAIIGILAAIAIPRYQDYVARSEVSSALSTLRGAQTGIEEGILSGRITASSSVDNLGLDASNALGTISISSALDSSGGFALLFDFGADDSQVSPKVAGGDMWLVRSATNGAWNCETTSDIEEYSPNTCGTGTGTP